MMQFWWVPGVARYYNRSRVNGENIFRTYEKPKRDTAEAPDMIAKAYQEVIQEESGDWPTEEESDEIRNKMNDSIDNDPRPPTAKDASEFYKE